MTESTQPKIEDAPVWELLEQHLKDGDLDAIQHVVDTLDPGEIPRVLANIQPEARNELLDVLGAGTSASWLEQLPDSQIAGILDHLEPEVAAPIVDTLPSNAQADVINDLEPESATAILDLMQPEEADDARRLVQYPEDTAGGIMITEYLAFPERITAGELLDDLRTNTEKYQRHDVQYIYVTNGQGALTGVLKLRDLVLTTPSVPVHSIMLTDLKSMPVEATLNELQDFFATRPYLGVPIVDKAQRLLGVVRHADVAEALGEQAASDHLKAQGIVGGEEYRTMPVFVRAWRRLSWLSINIVLNIVAASVIAMYQDTLSAVIVLAVFLPIISDMSGCSGNQAVAVSMRELTLGIVRPSDVWRTWGKELTVGMINAAALGALLGSAAYLWKGNLVLSLVVAAALALNTLVAVSLGGLVPLFLRQLKIDPALASGPILTTVTDMCGFFLVLSFASATLSSIT